MIKWYAKKRFCDSHAISRQMTGGREAQLSAHDRDSPETTLSKGVSNRSTTGNKGMD